MNRILLTSLLLLMYTISTIPAFESRMINNQISEIKTLLKDQFDLSVESMTFSHSNFVKKLIEIKLFIDRNADLSNLIFKIMGSRLAGFELEDYPQRSKLIIRSSDPSDFNQYIKSLQEEYKKSDIESIFLQWNGRSRITKPEVSTYFQNYLYYLCQWETISQRIHSNQCDVSIPGFSKFKDLFFAGFSYIRLSKDLRELYIENILNETAFKMSKEIMDFRFYVSDVIFYQLTCYIQSPDHCIDINRITAETIQEVGTLSLLDRVKDCISNHAIDKIDGFTTEYTHNPNKELNANFCQNIKIIETRSNKSFCLNEQVLKCSGRPIGKIIPIMETLFKQMRKTFIDVCFIDDDGVWDITIEASNIINI